MTVSKVIKKSPFLKMVRNDQRMLKLQAMIENGAYSLDTNALIKEIEGMHNTRSSRTIRTRKLLENDNLAMDVVLENQAFRSRVAAIHMMCYKVSAKLNEHLEAMTKHISIRYNDQLNFEFRTAKTRADAIKTSLSEFYKLLASINIVHKLADILEKDLDANHWTNTNMIKLLEMRNKREI